jgi:hypothetical protein
MIASMGLLQPNLGSSPDTARYDNAFEVWNMYRQRNHQGLAQDVADFFTRIFEKRIIGRNVALTDASFVGAGTIKIQSVAVWDTVGAMGIPFCDWHIPGTTLDVFKFTDTALRENVIHGIHAMSIDEKRPPFTPTFWDDRENVIQRLFSGAHSDVGGGYTEHGLSDCALKWIMEQLKERNAIKFDAACVTAIQPHALDDAHRPWDKLGYQIMNPQPRRYPQNHILSLHPCVTERMDAAQVKPDPTASAEKYQPTNIDGIKVGP